MKRFEVPLRRVSIDNLPRRYLAATSIEPAYLRSAIICYDEVRLKLSMSILIATSAFLANFSLH